MAGPGTSRQADGGYRITATVARPWLARAAPGPAIQRTSQIVRRQPSSPRGSSALLVELLSFYVLRAPFTGRQSRANLAPRSKPPPTP
jgi:hypothetical protein